MGCQHPSPGALSPGKVPGQVWKGTENLVPAEFDPQTVHLVPSLQNLCLTNIFIIHIIIIIIIVIDLLAWGPNAGGASFSASLHGAQPASHTMGTKTFSRR